MSLFIIMTGIACLFGVSFASIAVSRLPVANSLIYGLSLAVSLVCAAAALAQCLGGAAVGQAVLPIGLPWLHAHFRLDALSAFFLSVINGIGAIASLFGLSYGRHESEPARVLPFYPLFLAGMNLVVLADDAFSFLVAWEFMSLASWFLVLATHRERDTLHAAYVYLVMAAVSTVALFAMFGLLAGTDGNYSFDAMRAQNLTPVMAGGVLILALLGAGTKAGIVPLHAWLPLAHPAAPSHVSALMSGVMTKVAIYCLIRVLFDLVGTPQWWWGGLVMVLGGITAVTGVLYALMQDDLKRLLAYSTVENIGIIVIGLGLALAFRAYGLAALAGLALTAALFHVLNHALFKSLLFLGSGNILTATGTRDMEHMGGLIRFMPVTAFTFLIGSAAISALPPFNGFVSEWLTFQALLAGAGLPSWLLKFAVPVVGAMLALAAALAAVCFVKVFGIVFLGRPRSQAMSAAKECDRLALAPMVVLCALCAVIGIVPFTALAILRPAVAALMPDAPLPLAHSGWVMLIPLEIGGSSYSALIIFAAIALLTSILVYGIHRLASDKVRRGPPWDCGFPGSDPATQYTASSFAQPIRRVFGTFLFRARDKVDMPMPGELRAARFHVVMHDPVWELFYAPVARAVTMLAQRFNGMQFLSIRRYLSLVFAALVLLLIFVAVMQ